MGPPHPRDRHYGRIAGHLRERSQPSVLPKHSGNSQMKIVIPDDYQDMVDRLDCFALIPHHDVIRYREPAPALATLVAHLLDAVVVVSTTELQSITRAPLASSPIRYTTDTVGT